jgi:thiamine-phosphate pyrophosphorylase
MRGFYPILDLDSCHGNGLLPIDVAARLLSVAPKVLQLRAKSASAREIFALLKALRPLTRSAGTLLIANDRPDLAVLAGCDGVHLGQEDLPVAEVRSFAPGLRIGVSTHSIEQLHQALSENPDYVAFGPVFPTRSKARSEACVGVEQLHAAGALCRERGVPLVAIGGIDLARIAQVTPAADLVAVIGAFMGPDLDSVTRGAEALTQAIHAANSPA